MTHTDVQTVARLSSMWAIIMEINVKKLQFMHSVNGDGSKTAKIIKRQC